MWTIWLFFLINFCWLFRLTRLFCVHGRYLTLLGHFLLHSDFWQSKSTSCSDGLNLFFSFGYFRSLPGNGIGNTYGRIGMAIKLVGSARSWLNSEKARQPMWLLKKGKNLISNSHKTTGQGSLHKEAGLGKARTESSVQALIFFVGSTRWHPYVRTRVAGLIYGVSITT